MCSMVTYSFTITMVKLSILMLYRRIFTTSDFRQKILVVGSVCIVWCLLSIFIYVFGCRPFSAAFDIELLFTYHCINLQTFIWAITACNVGLDVVVLSLPIHQVWKLQLSVRKKISVSAVFLLGGL